ncbi:MAG: hypothetical protein HQ536_02365 [Parcubacteria group bacterium]|nr:hypothetical protein [Parcubacteria group bacterium]
MIAKAKKEKIERVVLKMPASVVDYFRQAFAHGKRSEFVAQCIMDYKHNQEIEKMEKQLRRAGKNRQN